MQTTRELVSRVELDPAEPGPILSDAYNRRPIAVRAITVRTEHVTPEQHENLVELAADLLRLHAVSCLELLKREYVALSQTEGIFVDFTLKGHQVTKNGKRVSGGAGWHTAFIFTAELTGTFEPGKNDTQGASS